jgi:hypothetical protein
MSGPKAQSEQGAASDNPCPDSVNAVSPTKIAGAMPAFSLESLQSAATTLAFLAAGMWFVMQGQGKPRLKLEHPYPIEPLRRGVS